MNDVTEEIITLDVEKIDFDDKEATKELFRKLLNYWFLRIRGQNQHGVHLGLLEIALMLVAGLRAT